MKCKMECKIFRALSLYQHKHIGRFSNLHQCTFNVQKLSKTTNLSAKHDSASMSGAWRARMLACSLVWGTYMLACLHTWRVWRVHVLTCLRIQHACLFCVLMCSHILNACCAQISYMLTCLRASLASFVLFSLHLEINFQKSLYRKMSFYSKKYLEHP